MQLCGFTYCDRLAWNAERERCVIGDYGNGVTQPNTDADAYSDSYSDGDSYSGTYRYTDAFSLGDASSYTYSDADPDPWQSSRHSECFAGSNKRGLERDLCDNGRSASEPGHHRRLCDEW